MHAVKLTNSLPDKYPMENMGTRIPQTFSLSMIYWMQYTDGIKSWIRKTALK